MQPRREFLQIGRQRKAHVFLFDLDFFQIGVTVGSQVRDEFFDEMLRRGGAGGYSDGIDSGKHASFYFPQSSSK